MVTLCESSPKLSVDYLKIEETRLADQSTCLCEYSSFLAPYERWFPLLDFVEAQQFTPFQASDVRLAQSCLNKYDLVFNLFEASRPAIPFIARTMLLNYLKGSLLITAPVMIV